MQRFATALLLAAASTLPMAAFAAKPCDELKTEIAAKLDAAGVKGYSLEIIKADADAGAAKVVGSCDAGKGRIVYSRGGAAPAAPAAAASAAK
jgi:hypothetical protein